MTMSVGNDHFGPELGAEKRKNDVHDTPLVTILLLLVSKREEGT